MSVVRKLCELDTRKGVNEGFTRGTERWLIWQMRNRWWMKPFPYRTYPAVPFHKVVHWHIFGKTITLPRPWAKDIFAEFRDEMDD